LKYSINQTHSEVFYSEDEKKDFFSAVFRKYYNNVIYYALHYVDTYEEAQDVAHDVFTSLWQTLDEYNENIFPCIMTMTKNRCLNVLRKEKYKRMHCEYLTMSKRLNINFTSLANSSIDDLLEKDAMKILMQTLEKMPPKTKDAFILSRFKHKTYSEIAQIQNVSEKNIEYRISEALKILRKAMGLFSLMVIINCL